VPSVGDRPPRELSRQALAEVVEPRYEELFTLILAELRRSGYEDMIPAGIVLTGGTAKMEGAVELAEEIFHMPVRLGAPKALRGLVMSFVTLCIQPQLDYWCTGCVSKPRAPLCRVLVMTKQKRKRQCLHELSAGYKTNYDLKNQRELDYNDKGRREPCLN